MKNVFLKAQLLLLLSCSQGAVHAAPVYEFAGHGSTGSGGWNLTLSAALTPDGASGFAHVVGGATGPIVEIVPPNSASGFWLFNVQRTDTGVQTLG